MLKKEFEEKQVKGNLYDIAKGLRSYFDVDKNKSLPQKDARKCQDKKSDIFAISRPRKRGEPKKVEDDIEVLSLNILNIRFLIDDPRPPNWNPRDPLLIIADIHQKQVHRLYIHNDNNTVILYKHCFRQLPTSWKEGL